MKRDRMEIMAQIVALCCANPKRKTRIMYQTNLSYAQLNMYLTFLTAQSLITLNSEEFITTQKGRLFLEAFNHVKDVLEDSNGGPQGL